MAAEPVQGRATEITEGSGFFKVRTDHDDRTVYEISNRSQGKCEVAITFTKCENIRLEMGYHVIQPVPKELNFTLDVPAGETRTLVVLYTADEDLPWSFDYDLDAKTSQDPEWLE